MTEQQITEAVNNLVSLTLEGKWEKAYEKYYHADFEKADLDGIVVKGKAANFEKGRIFSSKISNVRDFASTGTIIKGDRSFVVWSFDFDVDGQPLKVVEVVIQDWQDGKIIKERFFA